MENLKVISIDEESITFENDVVLSSNHEQDCCEHHFLSMSDLTMEDFEGLEFNLTQDNFFKRIEDYGIEIFPVKGHSIKIPGYGSNNGYYSSNLDLVLSDGKDFNRSYSISDCQVISG